MPTGKMHADEIDIDVALVRRLLAAQFPQWAELPIRAVSSAGTVHALYRLGADMVVRLPRVGVSVDEVDKEHHWLPRLAPLLPVSIPVPLGRGVPAAGYPCPWSVYRWLEGENPNPGHVTIRLRSRWIWRRSSSRCAGSASKTRRVLPVVAGP